MANVVIGVTGGIAAYKSAPLIRLFSEAGHQVKVVATANALRFIGATTLEALSKNAIDVVDPDLYTEVDSVKHVAIGKQADLIVVAPATASFIAKMAAGIADDLLTTTVLATGAPVVVAPAMHTEMWENAATRSNIETLRERGIKIVSPDVGRLTGEDTGAGRLAEPQRIFDEALALIGDQFLKGVRVLVTTGGTREPIDVARYIGNLSSGKQGLAFAKASQMAGADVKVIAANLDSRDLVGFDCIPVTTALELQDSLLAEIENFDLLIMAAAVADFRAESSVVGKIRRSELGDKIQLSLVSNPDILRSITKLRSANPRVIVGFAAEATSDLVGAAKAKLLTKGCEFIVANDISGGEVFGSEQNHIVLASADGSEEFRGSKRQVAEAVLRVVSTKLRSL